MGNPQNRESLKTGKRLLGHWAFDVNSIISGFNQTEQKENDTVNQGSILTRKGGKWICFSLNIIKTKMCARQLTPNSATNWNFVSTERESLCKMLKLKMLDIYLEKDVQAESWSSFRIELQCK